MYASYTATAEYFRRTLRSSWGGIEYRQMAEADIERFAAPETREYWRAAAEGRLLVQKCQDCGAVQFFSWVSCIECSSSRLGWIEASGRGKVYSFTVIHRAPKPELRDKVPYVLALVQSDEGVRMMSNIVECDPQTVHIDMPVRVIFEPGSVGVVLPKFRPV